MENCSTDERLQQENTLSPTVDRRVGLHAPDHVERTWLLQSVVWATLKLVIDWQKSQFRWK